MGACLKAAAAELERIAASAERLQLALSPLLRREGEAVEAFQAVDEITQQLNGLSQFLAAIARDCPPEWRTDVAAAAAGLSLTSQKLRLTLEAPVPLGADSGELELW